MFEHNPNPCPGIESPTGHYLNELIGKNIVVYDAEIKEPIGGKITWDDHHLMGLSTVCLFDYEDGDYKVYYHDNYPLLAERLNRAGLIVGFNIINFDNRLLRASGLQLKSEHQLRVYDMLAHSRKAVNWDPAQGHVKGLKLDEHLRATFGEKYLKTADGAQAPLMYQRGEIGKLISYCLADVRREKMLFEHIWYFGWVKTPTHGLQHLEHPSKFLEG